MSVSSTEGKTFYGIVVGGYDTSSPTGQSADRITDKQDALDPYGIGRVKVLCPTLHHITTPYDDLPWCYMASDASGIGAYSFNRPPPPGSVVEITYSPGTKSTGQGVIRSVIIGAHNPSAKGGKDSKIVNPVAGGRGENLATNVKGYIYKARNTTSKTISGPGRTVQSSGSNQTGTSKLTGSGTYKTFPNMAMREGFDNSLASKATISALRPVKSIVTADQWDPFAFPAGSFKGDSAILRQHGDFFGELMKDEFLKQAIKSACVHIIGGYDTGSTPTNFGYSGTKTNIVGWRRKAAKKIKTEVKDLKTLNDVLHEIMTFEFLNDAKPDCGQKDDMDTSWVMDATKYSYKGEDADMAKAMEYNQKDLIQGDCKPITPPIMGGGSTAFGQVTAMFNVDGSPQSIDVSSVVNEKKDYIQDTLWKIPSARAGVTGSAFKDDGTLEDKKGLYKDDAGIIDTLLRLPSSSQDGAKSVLDKMKELAVNNEFCRFMGGEGITRGGAKGGNIKGM